MAGYLTACITWHDQDAIGAYGKIAAASMQKFGGKYLARGAPAAALEGDQPPARLAIVEFPSVEAARAWHASSEYAPAVEIRKLHATTHWVVIMGSMP